MVTIRKKIQTAGFAACVAVAMVSFSGAVFAGEAGLLVRKIVAGTEQNTQVSWSKALEVGDVTDMLPCLVRSKDRAATMDAVRSLGGSAVPIGAGKILSVRIPPAAIAALLERDDVEFVEAASPLASKMDTARTYSNVVSVQDGSALDTAYDGTDSIVGVVDDGLDYGHPDFVGTDGLSRVQFVQQTISGAAVTCTNATILDDTCGITDGGQGTTHGTHVTGIAAGANSTYTGVAPDADIMFVFNSAQDADTGGSFATAVLEGVSAIFTQADSLDKPAVVNLSLGTSIGAHDGTSLLEQGLDDLMNGKAGRIIVNAAGNEQVIPAAQPASIRDYVGGIHAAIEVPAGESRGWRVGIWNGSGAQSLFTGGTLVDAWLGTGQKDDCSIAAFAYTQGRASEDFTFPGLATTDDASFTTGDVPFATDTPASVTANDGSVQASIDIDADDARNNKPHANIVFSAVSGGSASDLETRWFDVVVRSSGAACSGHMWLYFDYTSFHDYLTNVEGQGLDVGDGAVAGYALMDGDSQYTTTIPATATNVIAVGSFMPPKPVGGSGSQWTGNNGGTYDQSNLSAPGGTGSVTGDLSSFSSLGPTADGRTKPAIVAPGEPIIAAKARGGYASSAVSVGEDHFKNAGTSMASPHAAGIVALLMERNNTLTASQVRDALRTGADTSGMTAKTADPENSYGAGKVDAVQVLSSVGVDHSAYSGGGGGGGGSSGSSCALVAASDPWSLFSLLPFFLLLLFRMRRHHISN